MKSYSIDLSKDRLEAQERSTLSARAYNAVLGGTILYGIVANIVQCTYFSHHPISVYSYNKVLLGYLVLSILAVFINAVTESTLMRFLAYNMLAIPFGVALSCLLQERGLSVDVVNHAFTLTGLIVFCMISASFIKPNLFANLGNILFISLLGVLVASIVSAFIGGMALVDYFAAVVFSLYIGYDIHKAQESPMTVSNAIYHALSLYLDIINLFLRLLNISLRSSRK